MSVQRNQCRLDIQLYLDIPDEVLDTEGLPGWKRRASELVMAGVAANSTPRELISAFEEYAIDIRYKVSGGNVQLARDKHLNGES